MGKIYKNGIEYGGGGSGSGSSGHTILDTDGTSMPAEDNLQFIGLDVTDNSTDGVTEVESAGLNSDSLDDITNGSIGNEVISNGLVYSTNEQVVGKWIDGKPIYQKTVNCGAMPNNSTKQVSHEISDIGIIVDNKIFGYRVSDNTYVSVPFVHWIDKTVDVEASCNNSNIIIRSKSDWSAFNCYATIQYTKATD